MIDSNHKPEEVPGNDMPQDASTVEAEIAEELDEIFENMEENLAGEGCADGTCAPEPEAEVIEPDCVEPDPLEEIKAELAAAQAEAAEWKDKFMRVHTEWDAYRKRMAEQREAEKARATEKLVDNLIPVLDDFERTVDYAVKNGETGLLGGVQAVQTKLIDALVKEGVEVIDPVGEAYNALEAQMISAVPDDSVYNETVTTVFQKGFKMGIKVLRPAMVVVATGGPQRPSEDESEQTE